MTSMASALISEPSQLKATDCCDRCNARAYVMVRLVSGGNVIFCAHHFHDNMAALAGVGAAVLVDNRDELLPATTGLYI